MKRNIYNLNYLLLFVTLLFGFSLSAQWNQLGNDIDGETPGDQSGRSTSLSSNGNIVAIGSILNSDNGTNSGHVRVYENIGGSWSQIGQDIDGESAGDYSGVSVSLSSDGNIVVIGASSNDGNGTNSGHVRIYENIGGTWSQIGQDIDGEAQNDQSGVSVSITSNGNIVAIGAFANDGNGFSSGHVRIYENIGGSWSQIGQDIDGEDVGGGISVSLNSNGNIVAIGERQYGQNITGFNDGRVRMFENVGGAWIQLGQSIDSEGTDDFFGHSVSLDSIGNTVAIGAMRNDGNGSNSGHVRIFENIGASWTQIGQDIDGEATDDQSGNALSISSDGSIVCVGAQNNDGNGTSSGHARIYKNIGGIWTQVGQDIDGESAGDESGYFVSISNNGKIIAIGGQKNDGNGIDAGHVRVYFLCEDTEGTDTRTECNSYTWIDGNTYTSSNNTATYVLTNAAGCDSLITLDLTITNSNTGTDVITACDSYTWIDGVTYTANNNTATQTLTNAAGCDSVVTLNLTINNSNTGTDIIIACDSYTWIDGVTYTANNNTATQNLTNAAGCDSVVKLNLTVKSVSDNTITLSSNTIQANNSVASYMWLNCDDNYTVISGETNQSYTPTANGNYAVELIENSCVDTSACIAITTIGIIENDFGKELLVYPNPTEGNFSIDLGADYSTVSISISDINGKLIRFEKYAQAKVISLSIKEPNGVYLLTINSGDKTAVIRLIKN